MGFKVYEFLDNAKCSEVLAQSIAKLAHENIQVANRVNLAFSGGKSPIVFLQALSKKQLEWQKVCVSLVDERVVDNTHEDSNTALLYRYFFQQEAKNAHFIPMVKDANLQNEALLQWAYKFYQPVDIVVLGMGTDGHTASLFADSPEFVDSLETKEDLVIINPRNAPYKRISMSFSALEKCKKLFLFIQGKAKREVFDRAALGVDKALPISLILHSKKVECDVYYSK